MTDESGIQFDAFNPIERFKQYVRDWWSDVLKTQAIDVPRDSALYVEKLKLLQRAKKIRAIVEKIPGFAAILPPLDDQLGGWPAAVAVGAAAIGSVYGMIQFWHGWNLEFIEKVRVMDECLARGYDPKYCADIAAGLSTKNPITAVADSVPWIVLGLGIGFLWWSIKNKGKK